MSGIPPQLDVHPGTPTGEWAVKTTSALQTEPAATANAASTNPTTAQLFEEKNMRPGTVAETSLPTAPLAESSLYSAVSTPGYEVPGAYPNKQETRPVGAEITETVTDAASRVAQTVTETAQIYVPSAAEKIGQYLPKSVADMMSDYIPGMTNPQGTVLASANDIPHDKSLPSTELTGAGTGERVAGVGALPGTIAESSVTRLPDERNTAIPATFTGAAVAATETARGATNTVQDKAYDVKDRALHGGHTTAITASTVPSRELDGAQPGDHSSGVGALPGSINEAGVARLPDEGRGITGATSASVGTHARLFGAATLPTQDDHTSGVTGGVGSLPGFKDEQGVAVLPDERPVAETGSNFSTGNKNPKIGETAAIADAARREGVASHNAQRSQSQTTPQTNPQPNQPGSTNVPQTTPQKNQPGTTGTTQTTPQTKPEKKQEGKANAAAVGAAVGEDVAKHENAKDEQKKAEHSLPNKGDGYDTDYHPSQMHPLEGDYSKEHAEQQKEAETAGEKEQEKPLTGAKHTDSKLSTDGADHDDGQKAKKAGFMAKMKGEAMVLLGKVEGKKGHDKVEQGQRIKAGETGTASH